VQSVPGAPGPAFGTWNTTNHIQPRARKPPASPHRIKPPTNPRTCQPAITAQRWPTREGIQDEEIRSPRDLSNISQANVARTLNLSVGTISQLERVTKQPKGPTLALLNVIRRKGLETIL